MASLPEGKTDSTLGWDVVVSYDQSEINKLLSDSYKNEPDKHLQKIENEDLQVQGTSDNGRKYTIKYELLFGPPEIKFLGEENTPSCTLTIPINGGNATKKKNGKWTDFKISSGVYKVELSHLPMTAIDGKTSLKLDQTTDKDKSKEKKKDPFILPTTATSDSAYYVIIDFKTVDEKYKEFQLKILGGPPDTGNNNADDEGEVDDTKVDWVDAHKEKLATQLTSFFTNHGKKKVDSIQCKLARINPVNPPSGYVQMKPQTFKFASIKSDKFTPTYLSIFIQTAEKNSGTVDDLQTLWKAQWIGYGVPPIPDGRTASIIFNSSAVLNSVIKPAFQSASMDISREGFEKDKGTKYKVLTGKKVYRAYREDGMYAFGYNVDMNKDPNTLFLTIGQFNTFDSQPKVKMEWSYKYTFGYGNIRSNDNPFNPQTLHDPLGEVKVSCTLNKDVTLDSTLTDNTLKMDLQIKSSDWDGDVKNEKNLWNPASWFGVNWFENERPEVTTLSTNIGKLDFFLTTNLLMPNDNVFVVSKDDGLHIPRDYYLVGDVAKKT